MSEEILSLYDILYRQMCQKYKIKAIPHPYSALTVDFERIMIRIKLNSQGYITPVSTEQQVTAVFFELY